MKTTIKRSLQGMLLIPALALAATAVLPVLQPTAAHAQVTNTIRDGADSTGTNSSNTDVNEVITRVVNALLFIIGAVAVIMLIFGGFKYITSSGDASAVSSAKNTILYAVVGLLVAIFAYAIVNYVLDTASGS